MQAVILPDGQHPRSSDPWADRPPCLQVVGGIPLIRHQLNALRRAGVDSVWIVLGPGQEGVRQAAGSAARFVETAGWEEATGLHAFLRIRHHASGELLVLDSDVLLPPDLPRLLTWVKGNALAYDSLAGPADMPVVLADGLVMEMSPGLPPARSHGANVGLIRFDRYGARTAFRESSRLVHEGRAGTWPASIVNAVARSSPMRAVDVAGMPWIKIRSPRALNQARRAVWPAIAANLEARRLATMRTAIRSRRRSGVDPPPRPLPLRFRTPKSPRGTLG